MNAISRRSTIGFQFISRQCAHKSSRLSLDWGKISYRNASNNSKSESKTDSSQPNLFVTKTMNIRLPQTQDEALTVLTNWNYIRGEPFLESLRENVIKFDNLSDKQMEGMRKYIASKAMDRNHSAFKSLETDPIIMKLISLTEDDIKTIEKSESTQDFAKSIQDMKVTFFKYAKLTPKQLKFAGSVFNQVFKDDFNINGTRNNAPDKEKQTK